MRHIQHAIFFLSLFLIFYGCQHDDIRRFKKIGHPDIDRVRLELISNPTDSRNVLERLNTMKLWMRLLSFQGADLNPLRDSFMTKGFESKLSDIEINQPYLESIDHQYITLEAIYQDYIQNPDNHLVPMKREEETFPGKQRDWPTLRGDEGQTGFTRQSGPIEGTLKWKFPAGHAWYATPAFSDGRVYIGSPGVSYQAYCLDAKTGAYLWKTVEKEKQNQYSTPRNASPTLVVDDYIIVREIGSLGNDGPAKHLVYIDKNTGEEAKEVYAGHVDYRVGYAPFAGNDEFIVFPHSIQEIGSNSDRKVKVVSFDSLVSVGIGDGKRRWRHFMGEFYSEPLLVDARVYCGNYAGEMKCLSLETGVPKWVTPTGGEINSQAVFHEGRVIAGNQLGKVMSFDAESGDILWSTTLPVEERAFQNFSKSIVEENTVYIGSANAHVYALDLQTGQIKWKIKLDNWIRSSPVMIDGMLMVATASGSLYAINKDLPEPKIVWRTQVSTHAVYADLKKYQDQVYVSSSDFYIINIEPSSGKINWKTSVFESIKNEKGERIFADLVGGGPDYQAGTTIADGIAYFGSPRFVYAVDIETGKELWKFETRGQICGAPAVDNGKVFFGQQGGTRFFYCVNAKTGNLEWKQPLQWVWASPNVKDEKVYIPSVAGTFYCCDQQTGEVIWKYESNQGAYPAPSFMGDTVFFGSWNGKYYAFNKDNGALIWDHNIQGHPDSGSSIVKNGIFYAQGYSAEYFYAIDAYSGQEIWRKNLKDEWCNASPASDGKYVFYSTYLKPLHQAPIPSHTHCLNAKTGEEIYKIPFGGGLTGAVICKDLVFSASTTDPYMRAWDIATGEMRWQYRMGGRAEEAC